jgi:uncharacterized protein (TIGR02270 family)
MTAAPVLTFIPDLVEEHYDELQFLWAQRRNSLRSTRYTGRQLEALEDRIEGHADGMLVIGEKLGEFVDPGLRGDEEMPAFAAAFSLLRLGAPALVNRVIQAFEAANGKKLEGLRDALAHGRSAPLAGQLAALSVAAPLPVGAAAAEALAFQTLAAPTAQRLALFLRDEQPATRVAGWRVVAYCALAVPPEWYTLGLSDDDPAVKGAAATAAAWNASPTFAPYCRALAARPTPEAIEAITTFAAIATPEEYELVAAVARSAAAGPDRFRVVSAFAHPYFVDLLIKEMENADPATAVAAGTAFTAMTGRDVDSQHRGKVPADGGPPGDGFEAEFMDEPFLPDPELARKHWRELAPTLASAPRICRGIDVSRAVGREQFAALDMGARWEYCLRARLFGGWQGTPLALERYRQRA